MSEEIAAPRATARQLKVLGFIREYRERVGFSPRITEIADHFEVCRFATQGHIDALVKKGLLKRTPGIARSLVPT